MPATRYDSYESGGGDYEDNPELILTTYATMEAEVGRTFGASSQYGQSLGVRWDDVEVIDGCLYVDPEKQKFKLFSWKESNDMSPAERLERGEEPSADDANDFIRKSYAGNEKEYELVAARVEEIIGEDGDVIVEASSKRRDFEFTEDGVEFEDYTDLGGDRIELDNSFLTWFDAGDNGPTITAQNVAEVLTEYGDGAVVDDEDAHNWLTDTTGNDILRDDLEGRRIEYFAVQRQGENYMYNVPVILDVETGEQIQPNNQGDGDTGNSDPSESEAVQEAASLDEGDYPEPLADFLSTAPNLNLTEDRANALLDDLVESADNALTEDMLDDYGGREALIAEAV